MTFSDFFTKAIHENDSESLGRFTPNLMDEYDKQIVNWCLDYNEKYGTLPPIDVVKNDAPHGELYLNDYVKGDSIGRLMSEAKRQNYNRIVKEITIEENAKENPNHSLMAEKILRLSSYIKEVSVRDVNDIDDLYVRPKNIYNFKYRSLNNATNGLLGGEVCVFVAPEKSKKTWVLLDLYLDAVANQDKKAYIFSNELSEQSLAQRLHSMIGGFNPSVYRTGTQQDLDFSKRVYQDKRKEFDSNTTGKMIFPSSYYTTVSQVIQDIRNTKPDMVFIDSIHAFLDDSGRPIEDNWGALTAMVRSFKQLSMEMNIQVVGNAQLKRDSQGTPTIDDIALTKSIGRTSDLVVSLMPEDTGGVERVNVNILASRNSSHHLSSKIEFDFDTCVFKEYRSKILQNLKAE